MMKRHEKTQKKAILIALPIILVLVLLFVILICLFSKKEPVLNGGSGPHGCDELPCIVYDGNKYLLEAEDLFFEVQENWEELDNSSVEYMNFYYPFEEDIIYYDTTQPYPYDLYLRVGEEWLTYNHKDYTEGYIRFNFYYPNYYAGG